MELLIPFANTGEKEDFSTTTDPTGKVSLEKGFTELYELKPEEGGLFILRKVFNQMMNLVTTDTVNWKTQTFPNWIADKGDGLPFAYPKNAITRASDGENYVSLEDDNEDNPIGSNKWSIFNLSNFVDKTDNQTIAGVKTFSSSPIVPTPPSGDSSTKVATTAFVLNKTGVDNLLHIQDQKPAGTNGQSITAGTLTTRDLNTVITNNISGASLSSNTITLPAGTYFIDAKLNMHGGNNCRCTLRNNGDNSVLIASTNSQSNTTNTTSNTVFIEGLITLTSSTVLKISHISLASSFTGVAYNVGSPEIYSDVKIWKVG